MQPNAIIERFMTLTPSHVHVDLAAVRRPFLVRLLALLTGRRSLHPGTITISPLSRFAHFKKQFTKNWRIWTLADSNWHNCTRQPLSGWQHHPSMIRSKIRSNNDCTGSWIEGAAMIDHTGIGVADVGRSATFYDAALGALGIRRVMQMPDDAGTDGVGYGFDYPVFWIDRYHPHSVKQHTAFAAKTRAEVDAFHAAALKAGGAENGAPGLRRPKTIER
jgi:hypothetical protein